MHRIDTATKAPDLFGAGKDGFKDGDKELGISATELTAAFFNDLQENLAQLVEAGGDALVKGNYSQLLTTLVKKGIQGNYFNVADAAGTADAITAAYAPVISALAHGMTLHFRATTANATTTPTFTPGAGTVVAKTIVKGNNLPLVAGDVAGAGFWVAVRYDLTLDKWVLLNPATGISSGYFCAADEKAASTGGGTSVSGLQTRALNTLRGNTIAGASMSGNQITLPAGNYRIRASAPSTTGDGHRAYLYSVTDAAILLLGTSENSTAMGSSDGVTTSSSIVGRISIAVPKVIELRHYTLTAAANYGLGYPVNNSGNEVYSWIEITKE